MPISSVQSNIRIAINVSQRKDLFQHLHAYSILIAEVIIFFAIPAVGRFVVVPGAEYAESEFVSCVDRRRQDIKKMLCRLHQFELTSLTNPREFHQTNATVPR